MNVELSLYRVARARHQNFFPDLNVVKRDAMTSRNLGEFSHAKISVDDFVNRDLPGLSFEVLPRTARRFAQRGRALRCL